jgi:transcriptional regulator with PAS, ATPase and Fis domain
MLGSDPAALPRDVLRKWEGYPWPGNLRELRNAVARFIALGDTAQQSVTGPHDPDRGDLFERVLAMDLPLARARLQVVEAFERLYIERVLARHGGDTAAAAASSGIARRYFNLLRTRRK